ncbi:tyrosine-type recombinase/integrase [Rhizobium leguminosarum]|uniref:tyrosine-type recombinase/integrase n=1 Tax=Rhizobium leguminosarum TaxID=384 RepID=UPI000381B33C|nr:site-specific integrase [Rhizobium leguminosarum]
MAKALTVKAIEALKPQNVRQEIPDGGLSGLYIIVQPSGALSWAIRYRFDGRPKKFTVGAYPAYGLAQAREAASKALREVSEGRDPATEKVLRRAIQKEAEEGAASKLVKDVLDDFVKRHVEVKNRPSTINENKRIIEAYIKPKWGNRHIASITRADASKLIDDVAARAPVMANRVLALLRKFFNWCVDRDILDASPMSKRIQPPAQETSRDHILTDDEIRWLWKACNKQGPPFGSLVKLLLLTAQRRNEVAKANRKEFSLAGNDQLWTIPKHRAKNKKEHFVPLSSFVIEVIEEVPETESALLLTTTGTTPISGFSKGKTLIATDMLAFARQEAEERGQDPAGVAIERWTLHDLRRTAASGMARLGTPVHVVDAALNHRSGAIKGVSRIYNRYEYLEEKREALIAWADHVKQLTAAAAVGRTSAP